MPKSKRQTVVSLTKTDKKATRESKKSTIDEIQTLLDTFPYLWVFETEQMRTQYLQDVRKRWQPDRIMMGKIGVMRKAVGTTAEDEYKPGCAQLSEAMKEKFEIHLLQRLLLGNFTVGTLVIFGIIAD